MRAPRTDARRAAIVVAALAITILPDTLPAGEVDDAVARYVAALGGADAVAAVRSLRKTGTYVYNGLEHPIVVVQQRGGGCREEIEGLSQWGTSNDSGEKVVRAWDGADAWVGVWKESLEAQPMPEGEAIGFVLDADLFGALVDPAAKGIELSLGGETDVDGVPALEIVATHADGAIEHWYLDRESDLPIKKTTAAPDGEFKAAMTWYFDDYRRVDGVQMPFYVLVEELLFAREYLFDAIESNVEVAAGHFSPPGGLAAEAGE